MSGGLGTGGTSGSRSMSVGTGPPSASLTYQQPMNQQSGGAPPSAAPGGGAASQNLNQIVLEYLSKKGYSLTEAMLRRESAIQDADGRPVINRAEESGGAQYARAFDMIRTWIEDSLDIYKPELRRLLWPIFVYSFLNLVGDFYPREADRFFSGYKDMFARSHEGDLRALAAIRLPEHLQDNRVAEIYRNNKYRLTLSSVAYNNLIIFLETKEQEGGTVVIKILQNHMNIVRVERAAFGNQRSLSAMLEKGEADDDMPEEDEGIPGHNPGSANTDLNAPPVLAKLALGPLPMEPELMDDVRARLEVEDGRNPPVLGQASYLETFDHQIKQEPTEDAPTRDTVPLPPSLARDVALEVQRVKEYRDRFRIEGRAGGVAPQVSVAMYTFHNSFGSVICFDLSTDGKMIAIGTSESYVRVWSSDGTALPAAITSDSESSSLSRRLVGHAGPVYAVSFSPSSRKDGSEGFPTHPRYLLSCSADKTVRLWSIDTWTCLVVYKGHVSAVWDVVWGPFGHYFLTGSHDRTARLWSTDSISALRIFAGHDSDVDHIAFHPNGAYVFSCSCDKTVRMWDVSRGNAVRLFTGHTGGITALACAPNGKTLASADDQGSIILWDLALGRRMKRMRGHGKGGIWTLSWSVESTIIVSGGADGTVRVWDCLHSTAETMAGAAAGGPGKVVADAGGGTKVDGSSGAGMVATGTTSASPVSAPTGVPAPGGGRKGKAAKDVVVTGDQISAFPTKKTPVLKVMFTGMNLVLAAGAYAP